MTFLTGPIDCNIIGRLRARVLKGKKFSSHRLLFIFRVQFRRKICKGRPLTEPGSTFCGQILFYCFPSGVVGCIDDAWTGFVFFLGSEHEKPDQSKPHTTHFYHLMTDFTLSTLTVIA
ncbi:hypothetical protein Tsp_06079 [Trichinella spiralis]|uniref:hypothetical protein n=1 Tax=Trichinella spiralis TaxID=6334 RepID=UPI0001EFB437|nr:hypothetical protein Tsp_06079 [Trichinella spiralis]